MAFLPLDKKFHPDFAIPNKKPVTDVGSIAISDKWKGRILQAWMPTHGSRLYDVANNKFLSVPGGNTQAGKQGLVVDTATTSIATRADITSINKQEGCHIVCCSPDVLNTNHYIFDSTGTRQLAFFNGGGELVYYANGTLRVGLSLTGFVSAGDYINIVFEWPSSNIWINGKLFSNGTDSSISGIGTELTLFTRFNDTESLDGKRVFFATVNGPCNGQNLSSDPYQILKPVTQTGYFTAEATGANTLTADSGAYTYTGTASDLISARLLTAGSGSYAYTGASVDLNHGRTLAADSGGYTYNGTAAGLIADRLLTAASGSYAYTGTSAGLIADRVLTAESGSYAYTGTAAALTFASAGNFILTADSGAYTYSGTNAGLIADRLIAAATGSYTYSGTAVDLTRGFTLVASTGAYAYTGTAVGFVKQSVLGAVSGTYVYNGTNASLTFTPIPADIPIAGGVTVSGMFGTGATLTSSFGTGATVKGSL